MVYRLQDANTPVMLMSTDQWRKVYLQVIGPTPIRIARDRQTLAVSSGGLAQGITLTSSDGLVDLSWIGELWAIPQSTGAAVDIEVL